MEVVAKSITFKADLIIDGKMVHVNECIFKNANSTYPVVVNDKEEVVITPSFLESCDSDRRHWIQLAVLLMEFRE